LFFQQSKPQLVLKVIRLFSKSSEKTKKCRDKPEDFTFKTIQNRETGICRSKKIFFTGEKNSK